MNSMKEIIGFEVDLDHLPDDRSNSQHPEAIKYRVALARASNAIEGVILTNEEKTFMNNLPYDSPKEDLVDLVLSDMGLK